MDRLSQQSQSTTLLTLACSMLHSMLQSHRHEGHANGLCCSCLVVQTSGAALLWSPPSPLLLLLLLQGGSAADLRLRSVLDLADQVLFEPCYDVLRTKQQLGYSVYTGARLTHGVLGFCITVVSAAYSADHVADRIEEFLSDFDTTLKVMLLHAT